MKKLRHMFADAGGRRTFKDALAIFVTGYLLRLLYLRQIAASPLFNYLELDPRYYHDWAVTIAHGNWIGREVFEQAPLYPYLLAVYFRLFGEDLWLLRLLQIGVGACTCVLIYLLGLRLFERRAGLFAGVLCAVYGPFFFYEGQVMKEFLVLPLATGALILLAGARPPTVWEKFAVGVLLSVAALVRDNFLLLLPVLAVWLLYESKWQFRAVLPLLLGSSVILVPVAARNYYVGGDIILTTSGGGEVFYIGNGPYANGAYKPPPWVRPTPLFEHDDFRKKAEELTGRQLSRGEASHFWWKQGLRWLAADPVRASRLWLRKLELFWNDYELPDNYSFYTFRKLSWILAHTITFGPVVVLGWAGIALSANAWRRLLPIYITALAYLASVLIVFNFGRFRLPILPVLMVFAGHALSRLWEVNRSWRSPRERVRLLTAAAVMILAVPFVFASSRFQDDLVAERMRVVAAYIESGEVEGAERFLRQLIDELEQEVRRRYGRDSQGDRLRERGTAAVGQLVLGLAKAHHELGNVLNFEQEFDQAVLELRRSTLEVAAQEYQRAADLPASDPWIYVSLGIALRATGDSDEALKVFQHAVDLAPTDVAIRLHLANTYYERGQSVEALEKLEELRLSQDTNKHDLAEYHRGLGLILSGVSGRKREAANHLEESLRLDPEAQQAAEVRKLLDAIRLRPE